MQFFRTLTAAGFIAAAATAPVAAAEVSGAGSSFAYPIYARWIEAYKKETGVALDYRSVGSADGIRQVQSKQITFGASDMRSAPAIWRRTVSSSFRPSWRAWWRWSMSKASS